MKEKWKNIYKISKLSFITSSFTLSSLCNSVSSVDLCRSIRFQPFNVVESRIVLFLYIDQQAFMKKDTFQGSISRVQLQSVNRSTSSQILKKEYMKEWIEK